MKAVFQTLLFTFLFLQASLAQIEFDDSFTFEIGLPNAFTNIANKDIMQGLVCVAPQYQYASKSGFAFGIGLHYTYFNVNEFRVSQKVFGGIHTGAAYLKLGHEKFWNDIFGTDIGIKVGYLESYANTDLLRAKGIRFERKQALVIEPTIAFVLASDVNASYRFIISYPFYGYSFTPEMIGIDSNVGYTKDELAKSNSFLTVGFGYTFYFNGKKSTTGGDD
jgi:hypothetical protein